MNEKEKNYNIRRSKTEETSFPQIPDKDRILIDQIANYFEVNIRKFVLNKLFGLYDKNLRKFIIGKIKNYRIVVTPEDVLKEVQKQRVLCNNKEIEFGRGMLRVVLDNVFSQAKTVKINREGEGEENTNKQGSKPNKQPKQNKASPNNFREWVM